jgi:hypothetical protein
MNAKHLIDLHATSNGLGVAAYGGYLKAICFDSSDSIAIMTAFEQRIASSFGRQYFPVYRMADGEFRFLFGLKYNNRNYLSGNALLRYVKYEVFKAEWRTSWGERYSNIRMNDLRRVLGYYVRNIVDSGGMLALYWNENGLNAFTEYNDVLEFEFHKKGITLNSSNYLPFHACIGAVARSISTWCAGRSILIVSGMSLDEYNALRNIMLKWGAKIISFLKCSSTGSLEDNLAGVENTIPECGVDFCLVAAGIGSANILNKLCWLKCPIIDIGSFIHVLSGWRAECHAGFFSRPD